VSLWAVARIEERFSRLPWENANIVILRGLFKPAYKTSSYFIEGRPNRRALLSLIPVVEPVECGRSGLAGEAAVALRMVRDGLPNSGSRLIGRVVSDRTWRLPVPGVQVSIEGPAGTIVAVTDQEGVYDAPGIPPGHYVLTLMGDGKPVLSYVVDLQPGKFGGATFEGPLTSEVF